MKNFFGFDKTKSSFNCDEFLLRTIDEKSDEKQGEIYEEIRTAERKAAFPLWVTVAAVVMMIVGVIAIFAWRLSEPEAVFDAMACIAAVGVGLIILSFVILLINYFKVKKFKNSPAYHLLSEKKSKIEAEAYRSLGVPENADDVELLIDFKESKHPLFHVETRKIYRENDNICLAETFETFAIPIQKFTAVYFVNAKTEFYYPNEKTIGKEECKRRNLKRKRQNYYVSPCRYSIRITNGSEETEIVILPDELEKIKKYIDAPVY